MRGEYKSGLFTSLESDLIDKIRELETQIHNMNAYLTKANGYGVEGFDFKEWYNQSYWKRERNQVKVKLMSMTEIKKNFDIVEYEEVIEIKRNTGGHIAYINKDQLKEYKRLSALKEVIGELYYDDRNYRVTIENFIDTSEDIIESIDLLHEPSYSKKNMYL